jgi:hypothetical protein
MLFAISSGVVLAGLSSLAPAQTVLSVTPGWDLTPPLQKGYVVYSGPAQRGCPPTLDVTYILFGAEPNKSYKVTIGVFDAKPPAGIPFFGVKRWDHATYTREKITAQLDTFILGDFRTDGRGNGEAHFKLDLSSVPPGAYNVQFGWTVISTGAHGYYRTGQKFGQGFAVIKVP